MDFIEKLFGISPDGGDGSTELMIVAVCVIAAAAWVWSRLDRKRMRSTIAQLRHVASAHLGNAPNLPARHEPPGIDGR